MRAYKKARTDQSEKQNVSEEKARRKKPGQIRARNRMRMNKKVRNQMTRARNRMRGKKKVRGSDRFRSLYHSDF